MRDMVCSISMAQAVGMAWLMLPPTASQAARHRQGRTLFPPANREYLHPHRLSHLRAPQHWRAKELFCTPSLPSSMAHTPCCAVPQRPWSPLTDSLQLGEVNAS